MFKNLLILETLSDAEFCIKHKNSLPIDLNSCEILSLQPNIQSELKNNNIKSINTNNVLNTSDYKSICSKVDFIDQYLKTAQGKNSKTKIHSWVKNTFEFYLRYLIFNLIWNLLFASKFLKFKKYNNIFIFENKKSITSSPWLLPEQRLFSQIIKKYCKINQIRISSLNFKSSKESIYKKKNFIINFLDIIFNYIGFVIYKIYVKKIINKPTILIADFAYNMDLVCRGIKKKRNDIKFCKLVTEYSTLSTIRLLFTLLKFLFFKIKPVDNKTGFLYDYILPANMIANFYKKNFESKSLNNYVKNILSILKTKKKLTSLNGINLYKEIETKTENDILKYITCSYFLSFGIKRGLKILNPNFVLSQMSLGETGALGYFSETFNIPSMLISHGSHIVHKDRSSMNEHKFLAKNILVGGYRFLGVQSPSSKKMVEKFVKKNEKIINLFPTIWGRPIKKYNKSNFTVVYANTFKEPKRFIFETIDEFVESVRSLVNTLSNKKRIKLIIKFRESSELSKNCLLNLLPPLPKNVFLETKLPMYEVLKKTNLLISYSSTVIEEALINQIPVLLYGSQNRYKHIEVSPFNKKDKIEKPVTFVDSKKKLAEYFDILYRKYDSFKVPNKNFNEYCFNKNEGVHIEDWVMKNFFI